MSVSRVCIYISTKIVYTEGGLSSPVFLSEALREILEEGWLARELLSDTSRDLSK